jgi:predicted acyltransferase
MHPWLPINKSLWTSSFAIFMAGMAMVCFGALFWLIDVKGWRIFTKPFAIYGVNAITVYLLSGLIARVLGLVQTNGSSSLKNAIFQTVFAPLASPMNASLLYAIANVLALFGVAWFMYRRQWFVRF